jgi:hypothetical protein
VWRGVVHGGAGTPIGVDSIGGFDETVLDALEICDRRVCVHVKIDDLPVPVSKLDLIAVHERFVASERVCPGQMIVGEGQNRDVDVLIHDAHDTRPRRKLG